MNSVGQQMRGQQPQQQLQQRNRGGRGPINQVRASAALMLCSLFTVSDSDVLVGNGGALGCKQFQLIPDQNMSFFNLSLIGRISSVDQSQQSE